MARKWNIEDYQTDMYRVGETVSHILFYYKIEFKKKKFKILGIQSIFFLHIEGEANIGTILFFNW